MKTLFVLALAASLAILAGSAAAQDAEPAGRPDEAQAPEIPPGSGDPAAKTDDPPAARNSPEPEPRIIFLPSPEPPPAPVRKRSILLEPKALGYRFMYERFRVGVAGAEGSRFVGESDLGLEESLLISPDINVELDFDIFDFHTRLKFCFTDTTLHGLAKTGEDKRFSDTVFPAGTVIGTVFTHRRVQLRYIQQFLLGPPVEADLTLGGEYFYFSNLLDAPGFAREKDVTETVLPILGFRARYELLPMVKFQSCISGFYWHLGRQTGESGIFEFSAGLVVKLTPSWGFILDFSAHYLSVRKGDRAISAVEYWEFGPAISIYARM